MGEIRRLLGSRFRILSLADLNLEVEVPENGRTLEENALAKLRAYQEVAGKRIVLADDTGLQIDALDGEPGIHVRRWRDGKTPMGDEEIISYCLQRLKSIPPERRQARFETVIAVGVPGRNIEVFKGKLAGKIAQEPAGFRIDGFPFESLFMTKWGLFLGELWYMTAQERGDRLTHRQKALAKARDYLMRV